MHVKQFEIEVLSLKDSIARIAFYLLSDKNEAEDATQEILIKLWNMRDELDRVQNMSAYVLRVARNYCLDKIRAQNRKSKNEIVSEIDVQEKAINPYEKLELRDTLLEVKSFINTLPKTQRMVVLLRDVEGLEFNEIATIMDLTENAIKVNLSRARKKIRERFGKSK